jgi:hypothetical protein
MLRLVGIIKNSWAVRGYGKGPVVESPLLPGGDAAMTMMVGLYGGTNTKV